MKWLVRGLGLIGVLISAVTAYAVVELNRRPSLEPFEAMYLKGTLGGPVTVRYAGVSTLYFDDGETRWMTDGFFTRPRVLKSLLGKVEPDLKEIEQGLAALSVKTLVAVIPAHSHYDHAMDSPAVVQRTGGVLIGASSTMMIGRGQGLKPEQMREVSPGETVQLGKFSIHFIVSRHGETPFNDGLTPETIDAPLTSPCRAIAYKIGTAWSLLVEHESGTTFLIQASAGVVPGNLAGKHADTVFLGIGAVGQRSSEERETYWRETVLSVGAKTVVLIHWDDFSRPLSEPLVAMPLLLDSVHVAIRELRELAKRDGVTLVLPPTFAPFTLGLSH